MHEESGRKKTKYNFKRAANPVVEEKKKRGVSVR